MHSDEGEGSGFLHKRISRILENSESCTKDDKDKVSRGFSFYDHYNIQVLVLPRRIKNHWLAFNIHVPSFRSKKVLMYPSHYSSVINFYSPLYHHFLYISITQLIF